MLELLISNGMMAVFCDVPWVVNTIDTVGSNRTVSVNADRESGDGQQNCLEHCSYRFLCLSSKEESPTFCVGTLDAEEVICILQHSMETIRRTQIEGFTTSKCL